MITEDSKYRAEVFKILGVALMTPIGRFVLNVLELGLSFNLQILVNLIGSLIFVIIGIIFIQIGYEEVGEKQLK